MTVIRTFDKRPLYIPNSVFANIAVENPSRMTNRRIYETIGLRYDDVDKVDDIINSVKNMLKEHTEIDTRQTMIVNLNKFAPSSLDFFVYTFTKTTNWGEWLEIKEELALKLKEIVEGAGSGFAFPSQTVYVESFPGNDPEVFVPPEKG